MSADQQNASSYVGDDAILSVAVLDEAGNPLSLVSATLTWELSLYAGATPILTKTIGSGIQVTNASAGLLQISISHTESAVIPGGVYWHQLVVTDSNGDVSTLMTGSITLNVRSA